MAYVEIEEARYDENRKDIVITVLACCGECSKPYDVEVKVYVDGRHTTTLTYEDLETDCVRFRDYDCEATGLEAGSHTVRVEFYANGVYKDSDSKTVYVSAPIPEGNLEITSCYWYEEAGGVSVYVSGYVDNYSDYSFSATLKAYVDGTYVGSYSLGTVGANSRKYFTSVGFWKSGEDLSKPHALRLELYMDSEYVDSESCSYAPGYSRSLEFVDVKVNGTSVSDGGSIQLTPGTEVDVDVYVKNNENKDGKVKVYYKVVGDSGTVYAEGYTPEYTIEGGSSYSYAGDVTFAMPEERVTIRLTLYAYY